MKTILSLGVGVNSVALLVLKAQGIIDFDEAVFADTGAEQPETYDYWHYVVIPFCFDNNINLARINREGKTLPDHCLEKHIIPSRMFRWCTDKWKIQVQRKYALTKYGKEDKVNFLIGYAADEKERADKCILSGQYPLIDLGIDREGCKKIIREVKFTHANKKAGLPVPVKSGCWCCPYQSEEALIRLYKKHPELYAKAEEMEKNGSRYPEMFLAFPAIGRLEALRHKLEANKNYCPTKTTQRLLFCPMCEIFDEEEEVDYTGYENYHLQVAIVDNKPISEGKQ